MHFKSKQVSVFFILTIFLILLFCSCSHETEDFSTIEIMAYNVQTLFDSKDDGNEYDDFVVAKGVWDENLYNKRIELLSDSILGSSQNENGPDILILEEIENQKVAQDIADVTGKYQYIIMSQDEEALLSCAILSRYKVINAKAHRTRKPENAPDSVPRYILESEIAINEALLTIFAVHLKSKLGGDQETEPERIAALDTVKLIICKKLKEFPKQAIIIAGDFNENPNEYELCNKMWETALMPEDSDNSNCFCITGKRENALFDHDKQKIVFYCPWEEFGGYSYKYEDSEEQIDNMLFSPGMFDNSSDLTFESFTATPEDFLLYNGNPIRWQTNFADGYSDHLPIRCLINYHKQN